VCSDKIAVIFKQQPAAGDELSRVKIRKMVLLHSIYLILNYRWKIWAFDSDFTKVCPKITDDIPDIKLLKEVGLHG